MLKAFLRSSTIMTQPDNGLNIPQDIIPLSEAAENYEADRRRALTDSFEKCAQWEMPVRGIPDPTGKEWEAITLEAIHTQLRFALTVLLMQEYDLADEDDFEVSGMPDAEEEEGVIIFAIDKEIDRAPGVDAEICEKLFEFLEELQDCAEETPEDGKFELTAGYEEVVMILRYDARKLHSALECLQNRWMEKNIVAETYLNSAAHAMGRHELRIPSHSMN